MLEKKRDHPGAPEFRRPTQRRRAKIVVTRLEIGAVFKEQPGVFHVAPRREMVQWRGSQPVWHGSIHSMLEEKFRQLAGPGGESGSFRQVGAILQHEAKEALVAARALKCVYIIGQFWICRKDRGSIFSSLFEMAMLSASAELSTGGLG
jgi:hypothetical protein